jgi:predicted transcriptional regulator
MVESASEGLLALTADIVAAHVSNNPVAVGDLPRLIGDVYAALDGLGGKAEPVQPQRPAVSVRSSVKPDFIICLEDGKKLLMMKRHLRTDHQMTPSQYRAKWQLSSDYPMVAPNYSERRRTLAHQIGLGRRNTGKAAVAKANTKDAATKRDTQRTGKPRSGRARSKR